MEYRDLWQHRGYRLLFFGQVLSQLGDAIYEVGIVWLVYRLSDSPGALGWLAFCQSVPFLLFGLLAGASVDRWNKRTTMLISDVVRGCAVVYLGVRYALSTLTVAEVCLVAVVLTTARAFFHPAMRAMYPEMLGREQLLLANSLSEGAKRICKVAGMLLGGVLMAKGQAELMLWGNAASFFLSMLTLFALKKASPHVGARLRPRDSGAGAGSLGRPPKGAARVLFSEIGSAFGEIVRQRAVFFAVVTSTLGLLISAGLIKVGLPLLAGNVLHGEGDVYGVMMACFSVGMFLSAASMKKLSERFSVVHLVAVGWLLYGALLCSLSFAPSVLVACALVGATGFAHFLTDIPVTTLLQQRMPAARMSSCQSVWATASFGGESLGVVLGGAVIGWTAVGVSFAGGGVLLLLLGLAAMIKLRKNGHDVLDRPSLTE